MKALVLGQGAIGKRHSRVLQEDGWEVASVSQYPQDGFRNFFDLEKACNEFSPEYVVIANRTRDHLATIQSLTKLEFTGIVLVEKPIGMGTVELPPCNFRKFFVGYNLRFHPLIQKLFQKLHAEKLVSFQVYAGQYLPDWRPQSDYRTSYSSHQEEGGGVLLDLSHEADYLLWLCGNWRRVSALSGKFSSLDIDSEDVGTFLV